MNKSGIIILDKPQGISTYQLIQKAKQKLNIKKIGHAGTLDPLATGVVICLVNSGTKLSDYFLNEQKAYEVEMQLFSATDTYDSEGKVTDQHDQFLISLAKVEQAVAKFNGLTYAQTPPIYSAIKVDGKKLYQYALEQQPVEIAKRTVVINELILKNYDQQQGKITLSVKCSKGTYIRSLVVDIAGALKTYAHVTKLRRTQSGNFDLLNACQVEDLLEDNVINIYDAIKQANYPIVVYDNLIDVQHGKPIELFDIDDELVFIADENQQIYACYEKVSQHIYKTRRGGLNH